MAHRFEKKDVERRAARLVLAHCGKGRVIACHDDAPDFYFPSADTMIGLEIGKLSKVADAVTQQFEMLKVVGAAERKCTELGGQPLYVTIRLKRSPMLSKRNRDVIASFIAHTVIAGSPSPERLFEWEWRNHEFGSYPDCLLSIRALRLANGKESLWTSTSGGWPESGIADAVRKRLSDKESKLPAYLNRCDRCWLALVASWEVGEMFFEWSQTAASLEINTGFERVFFVDLSIGHVGEWQICRAKPIALPRMSQPQ